MAYKRILDPITLNLTSNPTPIPLPEPPYRLATVTLLVRDADAPFDIVDDVGNTEGVRCPIVNADEPSFSAGSYELNGLALYAVTATTATVTIVPVLNPPT